MYRYCNGKKVPTLIRMSSIMFSKIKAYLGASDLELDNTVRLLDLDVLGILSVLQIQEDKRG